MNPIEIGEAYNQIKHLWERSSFNRSNGIDQHKRAISFLKNRGNALDVGCGSTGRFIDLMLKEELVPDGIDISNRMIALAREKHPDITFYHDDICDWEPLSCTIS